MKEELNRISTVKIAQKFMQFGYFSLQNKRKNLKQILNFWINYCKPQ